MQSNCLLNSWRKSNTELQLSKYNKGILLYYSTLHMNSIHEMNYKSMTYNCVNIWFRASLSDDPAKKL